MKTMRAALLGVAGLLAVTAAAQPGGAKVDPALDAATKKFAQAFDAADPKAFATFFAPDATLINPMGMVAHGPAEIEKLFGRSGKPIFTGSRSTLTITGTRQLTPDTVWVDIDHTAENAHLPDGTTTLKSHMVLLAQKKGGDWKWAELRAFRAMPADAAHGAPKGGAPAK